MRRGVRVMARQTRDMVMQRLRWWGWATQLPAATAVTAAGDTALGGWLVLSGLLACTSVYHLDPGETVPWLLVAVAGTLVTLLLATRIPSFPAPRRPSHPVC
jgi:hypothetical protein